MTHYHVSYIAGQALHALDTLDHELYLQLMAEVPDEARAGVQRGIEGKRVVWTERGSDMAALLKEVRG